MAIGQLSPALSCADNSPDGGADWLSAVNRHRAVHGLEPWDADPRLTALAVAHSRRMDDAGRLFHGGMAEQAQREGWFHCVENLVAGASDGDHAVVLWHASDAHRINLLDAAPRRAGIGVSGRYAALLACTPGPAQWRRLGRPESAPSSPAASAPVARPLPVR